MILDSKYIKTDSNNYIEIINILKRFGYISVNNEISLFIQGSKDYIFFLYTDIKIAPENHLICCSHIGNPSLHGKTELKINLLLREYKLKRILK